MTIQSFPVENLPFLYVNGMIVSNDATTPNTILDLSAGQCRDSNDVMDITISTALTINSGVVGANGIDAGVLLASKVYAVYAIGDSTNKKTPAGIMTLASNSAPLMPLHYDSYRLIGYAVTDSSVHFLKAYISGINSNGRKFVFDAPQATSVTAGTSATYAAIDLSTLVAPLNNMPVMFYINWTANAAADVFAMQPVNATGDAFTLIAPVAGATAHTTAFPTVLAQITTAKPEVNYKVSAVGGVAIDVASFDFFI